MSFEHILGSMASNTDAKKRAKDARLKLSLGAFEEAAHIFGQVSIYYDTSNTQIQKALYYRHITEDAYYFGQMLGAQTSFIELEARFYEFEKEDYRAKPHEDPVHYTTNLTHLCHLYMDARFRRNWLVRSPAPGDFAGIYDSMVDTAIENGVMARTALTEGFDPSKVEAFFKSVPKGANLSAACASWIRHQDDFLHNSISEMVWLTLLPVLVARTGMVPLPALSVAACFSFNTFIHRSSFEEKMVYLSGVLLRVAKRAREKFTKASSRVMDWEATLKAKGVQDGHIFRLLPWLTVRRRFRVVDVMAYTGCSRACAARIVTILCQHNIIGYDVPGKRNKIYTTQRLFEL